MFFNLFRVLTARRSYFKEQLQQIMTKSTNHNTEGKTTFIKHGNRRQHFVE
jgi:hypothetical protein